MNNPAPRDIGRVCCQLLETVVYGRCSLIGIPRSEVIRKLQPARRSLAKVQEEPGYENRGQGADEGDEVDLLRSLKYDQLGDVHCQDSQEIYCAYDPISKHTEDSGMQYGPSRISTVVSGTCMCNLFAFL